MRILVTGATGFIGANLVRTLLSPEDQIYITVRQSSNLWRIADVKEKLSGICTIDLSQRSSVFSLIKDITPDIIYHTATYGGFPRQIDTIQMIDSNIQATINLLDAALENKVSQFINTGSSSEYGIKDHPMREDELCEPLNFYGITKLTATNYCHMVGKNNKFSVCTLRLFSPYGKYEEKSRLYPSIVDALLKGERPRLSKPDAVRDFIRVEDVISVYRKVIKVNYAPGDIINVGSGKQQTIREFYNKISKELNVNIEPLWGEAASRQFEPVKWEADISKLKALLKE